MLNVVQITPALEFRNPPVGFRDCATGVAARAKRRRQVCEALAQRQLAEHYGLHLSPALRSAILALIAAASATGRHEMACRIEVQARHREKWMVSILGRIVFLIVERRPGRAPVLRAFPAPSYRWGRA